MNPITTVRLQSTSSADQAQVPFTFGQVFKAGDLALADGLVAGDLPLQVDVKALHADGSVRHAIISGVYPKLKAGDTASLPLVKASPLGGAVGDLSDIAGTDAKVRLTIGGEAYSASLAGSDIASIMHWLVGPVVVEGFVNAPLKTAKGAEHPVLKVRFGVRYYPAIKQARIEVVVENCNVWLPGYRFTYDAEFSVGGKVAYSGKALTHYHHARWHQYAWTGTAPQVHVMLETAYLIGTGAVPNYDQSILPSEKVVDAMGQAITADNTGPMKIGTVTPYMGQAGGREDIGPLPSWAVNYILTMDKRAKDLMMANSDGSGSWSVHLRDEKTGYPLRAEGALGNLTLHPNAANSGPMPVPRQSDEHSGDTPYMDDVAHHPSLNYVPYLVTGDYYYLEELQFWAVLNPLGTDPNSHGHGAGLFRWLQIRGQAWGLRTLGQVAYITPDDHPLKDFFVKQVDNNLNFYSDAYVKGNPNKLGVYDGSGDQSAPPVDRDGGINSPPWQDAFFTWSFGYLAELGFEKAKPIAKWKSKFTTGRLTDPEYCWVMFAPYQFPRIADDKGKIFETFGELYRATFGGDSIPDDLGTYRTSPGKGKFIDLPCGSQAQADYLNVINGNWGWPVGRTNGLSDGTGGTAAQIQPALAIAADSGSENGQKAWTVYQGRSVKPDYSFNPQWNIIPRSMPQPVATPYTPPSPSTPPAAAPKVLDIGKKPSEGAVGEWIKVGDEKGRIKVENGSYVRYGVPGKAYRYAQSLGEFDATNAAFGGDPVPDVVKIVEAFKASPPKQAGKLKLGSNKKLAKLDVTITVFDPYALKEVKVLSQTMNASGSATLSDSTFTIGQMYGVRVEDAKGNLLDTKLPIVKAVK